MRPSAIFQPIRRIHGTRTRVFRRTTPGSTRSAQRYASYYAAVTDIDRNVERILQRLREQGRLDNTLVIYTSDHGLALGHHGFWGKGNSTRPLNMYETSLRVPLMLAYRTGFRLGRSSHTTWIITIPFRRSAIGREYIHNIRDNRGIIQVVVTEIWRKAQPQDDWDDTRYGEYGDLRMIRTPKHKLIKRYPHGPDELFGLEADPEETINIIGHTEYTAIERDLETRLDAFYTRFDDRAKSGLRVKELWQHNRDAEAWRDGRREARGLQL